jgi:hypothetical protein
MSEYLENKLEGKKEIYLFLKTNLKRLNFYLFEDLHKDKIPAIKDGKIWVADKENLREWWRRRTNRSV